MLETPELISAASGPQFAILWGHLEDILLLNKQQHAGASVASKQLGALPPKTEVWDGSPQDQRVPGQSHGWGLGLGPGDFVLDGSQLTPPKRGHSPQFSAHVYCGQTGRWIKMPLRRVAKYSYFGRIEG